MYQQILLLYDIQTIDLEIEKIQEKYNRLKNAPNLKKTVDLKNALTKSWENTHLEIKEKKKELRQAEMDLIEMAQHLELIENKIYDSKTSSKELQFLLKEKEAEQNRSNELEIGIIKLLELIDTKEDLQSKQKNTLRDINKKIAVLNSEISSKVEVVEEKLANLNNRRILLIKKLDHKVQKEYVNKRVRLKHKMVSTVNDDRICSGCNVRISSQAFKKVHEKKVARCEECGRYLIIKTD